uniref:Uncharacterized protein n=1 Tax=Leviviridae sp. TaxID=2027243 RepID=A0A514D3I1_9VIRU|nr:MAG: hypothetical protein H4RhizoLitter201546_000002 [Leviviridae sp.]
MAEAITKFVVHLIVEIGNDLLQGLVFYGIARVVFREQLRKIKRR